MLPKKRLQRGVEQFRRQFGDQPTRALGAVLPSSVLRTLVEEEVGAVRERIYPPLDDAGALYRAGAEPRWGMPGCSARRLSERTARGQTACSLNSGPYCKARQRLPLGLISRLAVSVGEALERSEPTGLEMARPLDQAHGWHHDLDARHRRKSVGLSAKRRAKTGAGLPAGDAGRADLALQRGSAGLGAGALPRQTHRRASLVSHADAAA